MARYKDVTTVLNMETGDYIVTKREWSEKIKPETFYMSFIENMSGFFKLKSSSDIKLLVKMCTIAEFNTGTVSLATATRITIAEELDITNSQISKSINNLIALKLITGGKGIYTINPSVFWKGDAKSREALMKNNSINITISID